jgi:predicted nuclease of predicted toxin-antitoxin system
VKLLFDENLSPRLVGLVAGSFPDSTHVDLVGLHGCSDGEVWDHARVGGYAIVSKDNDFRQLSFLHGAPPKVVWLSVGNAGTEVIANLLDCHRADLARLDASADESLLVIELPVDR